MGIYFKENSNFIKKDILYVTTISFIFRYCSSLLNIKVDLIIFVHG